MTVLAALVALAVSLAAIAYLAATDPKRRRIFDLPPTALPRRPRLGLAAVLLPGLALALLGTASGFVVWLGAVSVTGWGVAALRPGWAARSRLAGWSGSGDGVWQGLLAGAGRARALARLPHRVASLERQVADLQAELARLRPVTGTPPTPPQVTMGEDPVTSTTAVLQPAQQARAAREHAPQPVDRPVHDPVARIAEAIG